MSERKFLSNVLIFCTNVIEATLLPAALKCEFIATTINKEQQIHVHGIRMISRQRERNSVFFSAVFRVVDTTYENPQDKKQKKLHGVIDVCMLYGIVI